MGGFLRAVPPRLLSLPGLAGVGILVMGVFGLDGGISLDGGVAGRRAEAVAGESSGVATYGVSSSRKGRLSSSTSSGSRGPDWVGKGKLDVKRGRGEEAAAC